MEYANFRKAKNAAHQSASYQPDTIGLIASDLDREF